ncbi:sugar ABC transporter substrate-binding protein [Paenibacillus sp. J23TS9]|uniref:sugar ABC transporter substrate-binding protein n=1 Tax=Paenibacillus sp. J23TS9 TaxID=2807193 RepID=UPI001B1D78EC|nr:sugar ABC transporter substrate-binding protein [Paenibacillus sp. J23TS9]GIP27102.1 sugar ABC transporter substrate-binding protein [Paenibacillus sp. J23TS9]
MKKKTFSKLLISLFAVAVVATGCSSGGSKAPEKKVVEGVPDKIAKDDQVKIMVVRKIGGDDHTAQFLAGAKQEGTSMGFVVDTFSANGDTAKFHDAISQALEKDYDGFIISHGDDAATVEDVKKITAKGLPVVAFDSNPDLASVQGVTLTSQDDENLAKLALTQMNDELKGQGKIIYLWVDGFPPMVRRNAVYKEFMTANPGIQEIERFGIASADTSVQTQNAVSAMLTKHKKGEISAIFATWDAFAIGAARAVKEAGRDEVKIYGIDVSNADLQMMQEDKSPWVSTAAVDPKVIGQVDVRMLAKKIAGEEVPQTYDLAATLITQDKLKTSAESVNMVNLAKVMPGWGVSDAFEEPWMKSLKEAYAK